MELTLEDVYFGKTVEHRVMRTRVCKACNGNGGADGHAYKCEMCEGVGKNMVQMQDKIIVMPCQMCSGRGEFIEEIYKCQTCNGKKIGIQEACVPFVIDKGTPHNEKYTLIGEAAQEPGKVPGDIIVICKVKPHERFTRKGADLHVDVTVSLIDALTGVDLRVKHIDGTEIRVQNEVGEVIAPGSKKVVEGKGLPFY